MKDRKIYIDIIRLIAIYGVILNHTNWMYGSFNEIQNYNWLMATILYFIAKSGVPLFIMITGAMSLGREQNYKKIVVNIVKTAFFLLIWSVVYWIYQEKPMNSISYFVTSVIDKPVRLHLWYLYMLIGLYMMMPFIQKMLKTFKPIDFYIYLSIWFAYTTLLPFLRIFKELSYTSHFSIPLFYGFSGYLVLGYFIANLEITKKVVNISWISLVTAIALMLGFTYHFSSISGQTWTNLDNIYMFPIVIISATLFLLVKHYASKWNSQKLTAIMFNISLNTFGIYLVHVIVKDLMKESFLFDILFHSILNPVIGLLIYDFVVLLISYLITVLIGKIPYVRRMVYF